MAIQPVPRGEWWSFCQQFSSRHHQAPVDIEVYGPEHEAAGTAGRPRLLARHAALQRIHTVQGPDAPGLCVIVGRTPGRVTRLLLPDVAEFEARDDEEGRRVGLCVRTGAGQLVVVRLCAARPTETSNGEFERSR